MLLYSGLSWTSIQRCGGDRIVSAFIHVSYFTFVRWWTYYSQFQIKCTHIFIHFSKMGLYLSYFKSYVRFHISLVKFGIDFDINSWSWPLMTSLEKELWNILTIANACSIFTVNFYWLQVSRGCHATSNHSGYGNHRSQGV